MAGGFRKWYGFASEVVNWENDGHTLQTTLDPAGKRIWAHNFNLDKIFLPHIGWSDITSDINTFRYYPAGYHFSSNAAFTTEKYTYLLIGLCNSKLSKVFKCIFNPTMHFTPGNLLNIPFSLNTIEPYNGYISQRSQENIDFCKRDWDTHETSWDFKQNELIRMKHNCGGNVADLDLLTPEEAEEIKSKYNVPTNGNLISDCLRAYKSEWTRNFKKLHFNEEELNRKFIEIYGLQDELKPDVPLDEITILQQGEISIENDEIVWHDDVIIKQLISYAVGCWMGRYRLDKEGLNIAYYPKDEEICSYSVNGYEFTIDDDAIIPLMGHENPFEDDNALQKIVNFVKMVFGADNLTKNLNVIEHSLGKSIEDYLVKDFWKDHKKMYQNRPIYWLFSSKKGAFQCLVYMHRMNPYTAEKVRTKYLLPYIEYLQGRIQQDKERGADLTTVERKALAKMEIVLEECQEYHERLHDVAIHNIDFDLDDGVVVNYAKFGDVLAKIK